jgi:hypothetical protein
MLINTQDELNRGTIKLRKPLDQMMAQLKRKEATVLALELLPLHGV